AAQLAQEKSPRRAGSPILRRLRTQQAVHCRRHRAHSPSLCVPLKFAWPKACRAPRYIRGCRPGVAVNRSSRTAGASLAARIKGRQETGKGALMQTPYSLTGKSLLEFVEGLLRRLSPSAAVSRVQDKIAKQLPLTWNPQYRRLSIVELQQRKSAWRKTAQSWIARRKAGDVLRLRGVSLNDAYQSGEYFSLLAEIEPECIPPISDAENDV